MVDIDYGKYTLIYKASDYNSCVTFNADVDIEELREKLRYFLLSCSWLPSQVDDLLGGNI